MMVRRLGGATGDTLGATCELVEAVVVVTVALIAPVYLPSRTGE
jgi:cobalamin synthase